MVRRSGKISVNTAWIFCEGKTEYNYFVQFRAKERIRGLQIKPIVCEDKNIVGLVNYSIDYQKHHARDFLKGDSIFYVFDRDANTNEDLRQAEEIIRDANQQLILSNPCFEYWILSHFEHYFEPIEPKPLERRLRRFLNSYEKNDPNIYNKTKERIGTAMEHSKKVCQIHLDNRVKILSEESNPSTMIFQLVEIINKYKT
ncbi:hypothetical protein FXV91_14285 [Methanosarcina sp. DH2]|uniref:RloB family protein n=1 Tax=Methanosarcina sp. DH2 TaxID=2605639 RepID=UPI001E580ADF|nr:RloB family protein [Methanosarcina sp. DH2]MCC4771288.1 hypothetical protein [Methanosarcina sp. DH2]